MQASCSSYHMHKDASGRKHWSLPSGDASDSLLAVWPWDEDANASAAGTPGNSRKLRRWWRQRIIDFSLCAIIFSFDSGREVASESLLRGVACGGGRTRTAKPGATGTPGNSREDRGDGGAALTAGRRIIDYRAVVQSDSSLNGNIPPRFGVLKRVR